MADTLPDCRLLISLPELPDRPGKVGEASRACLPTRGPYPPLGDLLTVEADDEADRRGKVTTKERNSLPARMFTSEKSLVLIIIHPNRCHKIRLLWYITTMGQPAAATSRVALPLATIEKSTSPAVLLTESTLY